MSRPRHAKTVIAEALKAMQKADMRLSPQAHSLVVGKLAAALKSAYPKFEVDAFVRDCGL